MKINYTSKISICLLFSLLFFNLSSAQTTTVQDCSTAISRTTLDVNNVEAEIFVGGDLWWDGADGQYIYPKPALGEPEVSALYAGGLWIGGFDSGGTLKMAAQTYGTSNGNTDYWAGPLTEAGETTFEDCQHFDRFWTTTSIDINAYKADWADNGTIDGTIPESILAWPATGNPNFESIHGFELPNTPQGMAAFIDINGDGIYDPQNGDYPNINEADQGHWWVFNDAGGIHSESGGVPLQLEIQVLAYAYSSSNDNINNATFYDYKFINRGLDQVDSTFVGLWVDPDLGCHLDDYFGCDTLNNMAFVYNSDDIDGDEDCFCNGINTYCDEIPILGIKILEGVKEHENGNLVDRGLSSFTYYNNGGINPSPNPGTTDPSIATEYYNYLNGTWRDGSRVTAAGNGYNPGNTDYTKYVFPDAPDDINGWSMAQEQLEVSDRRMVVGSGPFQLNPGEVNTLSFAVIIVGDVNYPAPSISPLLQAADDVQNLFNQTTSTEHLTKNAANIGFYPNPMNGEAKLIFNELTNSVEQVSVFSIDGKLLRVYDSVEGESLTIEKGELGSGMYFYKILTDDFKVYSGKFVVQ